MTPLVVAGAGVCVVWIAVTVVSLWVMRAVRRAQVEHGLQLELLTGLIDGRFLKVLQDVAEVKQLVETRGLPE